ncbi:MAG: carotenoid biosynthesis protein, partial [Promethearchaeota archaeon]
MAEFDIMYSIIGFVICGLAIIHVWFDVQKNRIQRVLMLISLFIYAIFLEYIGITTGNHYYTEDIIMILDIIPISIPLAWVGIMYSSFITCEHLKLSKWKWILTSSLLSLSLDWGMDPIAVQLGLWTWVHEGSYFGVPSFNFIGWFLIPISYLLPCALNWNGEKKRPELLSIKTLDMHDTLKRKLYTLFLVPPISLALLLLFGFINLIPIIYNLPFLIV